MTPREYIKEACKTESFKSVDMSDEKIVRLLHASLGLTTESAEFADALKKHLYYHQELDEVNLKEEMGDLFWYLAVACDALNVSFEDLMERNIEKLRARYGEKFSSEKSAHRNLEKEHQILAK